LDLRGTFIHLKKLGLEMKEGSRIQALLTASTSVSVVICTHNGARRLPQTLAHLKAQETPAHLDWEVIVVDNASKDTTAEVALACWRDVTCAPLRVVHEPRLGVSNARVRGLTEARYDFVAFVDDDNWVCTQWVATVSKDMSSSPRLGAVAGLIRPVCEVSPPRWFNRYKMSYAIFDEGDTAKFGVPPNHLYTAGMTIRREAWNQLLELGFRFHVNSRKGASLEGNEDVELTRSLRLAGWELAIDPTIALEHFLPAHRLTWQYLRRSMREGAASAVPLEAHFFLSDETARGRLLWIRRSWWGRAIKAGVLVVLALPVLFWARRRSSEGCQDVLEADKKVGRFYGLLKLRSRCYDAWEDYAAFRRAAKAYSVATGKCGNEKRN
jgi:glycosyltransferase involved in cell wall biosynthesis